MVCCPLRRARAYRARIGARNPMLCQSFTSSGPTQPDTADPEIRRLHIFSSIRLSPVTQRSMPPFCGASLPLTSTKYRISEEEEEEEDEVSCTGSSTEKQTLWRKSILDVGCRVPTVSFSCTANSLFSREHPAPFSLSSSIYCGGAI